MMLEDVISMAERFEEEEEEDRLCWLSILTAAVLKSVDPFAAGMWQAQVDERLAEAHGQEPDWYIH